MKMKIATALASDVSELREKSGSRGPRGDLAAATTDRLPAVRVLRFLAATAPGAERARWDGRSIFLPGRGGTQALPSDCVGSQRVMQRGGAPDRERPLHLCSRVASVT